jgi:hypothetical protein
MAFSDTQTLTVGATPITLKGTFKEGFKTVYSNADSTVKLALSHVFGRRNRHTARVDFAKIAADPISGMNSRVTGSVILTIDVPKDGFTNAELKDYVLGLGTWESATSGANVLALLGGES